MENVKVENDYVFINNIVIDDANTYKILKDIKENKREDFIKKAIVIGTIGLRNIYLTENVDYIEKEFKELSKGLENQSKDIKYITLHTWIDENVKKMRNAEIHLKITR